MKLVVMFDNLGPYHIARLSAASRRMELAAVETFSSSIDYAWGRSGGSLPFARTTLFEGGTSPTLKEFRRRLFDGLDAHEPGVVAVSGYSTPASLMALTWCVSHNVPAICMSESHALDARRIYYRERVKTRLLRNFSSALVGGSRHKDYFVSLGMPADQIFIGYDAVDNHYFSEAAARIRDQAGEVPYGWTEYPFKYFLASSRFIAKKNLPRLLEAFALFMRRVGQENGAAVAGHNAWKLVVLGDGPLRPDLQATVGRLNIENDVLLPGFVQYQGLPGYYASAFAFIHVSVVEQWGLVVNEAMASGLPIVVSRACGCVPDLVTDRLNGFVVDPEDIHSIADRMWLLATNTALRDAMARESEIAIADWGVERFAESLLGAAEAAVHRVRRSSSLDLTLARLVGRR